MTALVVTKEKRGDTVSIMNNFGGKHDERAEIIRSSWELGKSLAENLKKRENRLKTWSEKTFKRRMEGLKNLKARLTEFKN